MNGAGKHRAWLPFFLQRGWGYGEVRTYGLTPWIGIFLFLGIQNGIFLVPCIAAEYMVAETTDSYDTTFQPELFSRLTPTPTVCLTLDQTINQCLLNDPKIRTGFDTLRQAKNESSTASLAPSPEFAVGPTLSSLSRPSVEKPPSSPKTFDMGLSYPVDWFLFGKRAAVMESASLGVGVSEAEYTDQIRQRVTETSLAFFNVLEARELLVLARQNVLDIECLESATARDTTAGIRPVTELQLARNELLDARQYAMNAECNLAMVKSRLLGLLGESRDSSAFEFSGSLEVPITAEPLPLDQAFLAAKEHRPDILALRRKIVKAQADIAVEDRNALPEISSEFGVTQPLQRQIGSQDISAWGTGLAVTVPLFNRNQGNRVKAHAMASETNCELQTALQNLRDEVEYAIEALQHAKAKAIAITQDQLQLTAQVRANIHQAYQSGNRTLNDSVRAQHNYCLISYAYITSRADYLRALCCYNAALGEQAAR